MASPSICCGHISFAGNEWQLKSLAQINLPVMNSSIAGYGFDHNKKGGG